MNYFVALQNQIAPAIVSGKDSKRIERRRGKHQTLSYPPNHIRTVALIFNFVAPMMLESALAAFKFGEDAQSVILEATGDKL